MLYLYAAARQLTLDQAFDWGSETLPLSDLGTRVLAQKVTADRAQPPYDRVTMDGIAFDFAAYKDGQRLFPVAGIVAAGTPPPELTDPTTCFEVMTGAVRPPGSTTIVRYEDLEQSGAAFRLPDGIEDGKNIHRKGSDAELGAALMQPGTVIKGAAINLLAGCGYAEASVKKLPRTAVIATGDELVAVAEQPLPHQIRMSNLFHLQHQLATAGIAASTHHFADDPAWMKTKIGELLSTHDLLIFSGGVSKGRYDFLPDVLAELGVKKLFHRVAQRPGKPIWVGRTAKTMVFGLPGNPVSSLTGLLAYVGPWLRQNLGLPEQKIMRELATDLNFPKPLTLFQLCTIDRQTQSAVPVTNAGSGDAASMLRGDGLLVLPAQENHFPAGERFAWIPFDKML
jgi:molybdopterin molybdotransferase